MNPITPESTDHPSASIYTSFDGPLREDNQRVHRAFISHYVPLAMPKRLSKQKQKQGDLRHDKSEAFPGLLAQVFEVMISLAQRRSSLIF